MRGEGWDVERLREPTDGPWGRRIRELARSGREDVSPREELDLFLEDRRQHVRERIAPALERGAIVLMDRYYYSTIAYQGARGLDPVEWAGRRIEQQRGDQRDRFEKEDYLRRVKAQFDAMEDARMMRIDATENENAVFAALWAALESRLAEG